MPKNRKLQNIIGTEHITDAAEAAIAAQASGGATVAFKNVAVHGQDNIVADASADTLNVAGAGSISVTTNAANDTLTITGTDTNTQLSTEQVQDIVGAMFTGNTETGITATYEDSDGTIDLVASGGSPGGSDGQMQYNNGGSFGGSSLVYTDTTDAEQFKIDVSSSVAPLVLVQTGTGNAFEVHDDTDPDNNRFEIDQYGRATIRGSAGGGFGEALYVGGNTISNRFKVQSGSASDNSFSHAQDTNTGIHFPATDNLGFATAGQERLRVGSSGEIGIGGANYGTSGQVLTSGGSGSAVSWTTVSGGGGSGYMQAVTNWPNFGTNVLVFVPSSNPPLSMNVLTVGTNTLSDDIQFAPWIFRQDTTIKEIGFRLASSANPAEMCVYESNSDGFPTNKVANSTATFASPSSGTNMATMAAGSSGITFSANELYWCAITNTTTGANLNLTTHGTAGSVVGMPGGIYNRSTLQLVSGTVNALPSSIGTLSISAGYQAFMAFAKKA